MGGPVESVSMPMYFERNDAWVVEAFRRGEFDYLEGSEKSPRWIFPGDYGEKDFAEVGGYAPFAASEARGSFVGVH